MGGERKGLASDGEKGGRIMSWLRMGEWYG